MSVENSAVDEITSIRCGLEALALTGSNAQYQALSFYLGLLAKWNRVYNLTSIRDRREMVILHLLDSLAVTPCIEGPVILDVGSGAGLPGIPLAIMRPDWRITLLDANSKKSRFATQAVVELGLKNVTVINARIEAYRPPKLFDTVISRAFASIAEMVIASASACRPGGQLAAMKGRYPQHEIDALCAPYVVEQVYPIKVPGLDAQRHLVSIRTE
ncbi:MAG: 16S rRNA (guanine(527)-N(7))-methyltransferase RsmG [Gammaproteobacteria bacterium]|nr:16S rRNA (guanine(527)-N(7))-methyltransferase RsmG [Gammaproteobacteria bacterium]